MNVFTEIETLITESIGALAETGALPPGLPLAGVTAQPPKDAAHGDVATNAAMALAKPAGMKPRDVAAALATALEKDPRITRVEIAGPGFLNLTLSDAVWRGVVAAALTAGTDFGRGQRGAGRRVCVEYVSANPTGPLHVGHARGAVVGDALAGVLDFAGWAVTREYYVNDGGSQVDTLARSAFLRYREAHGEAVTIPEGLYPGDYLRPVGERLKAEFGDALLDLPEEAWLAQVREASTEAMMDLIREDLAALGVTMDVFFSEKSLYGTGRIEAVFEELRGRDLVYQGVLEPPKGKKPEDWEPREQMLFRATAFGDDVDRPVQKSDGSWTYFAPDVAYHADKVSRGFDLLINVLGADHGGYVKRLKSAVAAVSDDAVPLEVMLCQLVKLIKNGQPFKMSKRSGAFETLRDVIEEVGSDVARFTMLTRKNDAPLEFDFDKAREQSKDNPVYYVQYAHARIASALREGAAQLGAEAVSDAALRDADLSLIADPRQLALIKRMADWPRQADAAAASLEPHRVAFYLYDLASAFHAHYHEGRAAPELRFLQADDAAGTRARLALVRAVGVTLAAGLKILGVTPAEEMR